MMRAAWPQIVRTGWFTIAQIECHDAYVNRATLKAREVPVSMRVKLENKVRGLLKTFGIISVNGSAGSGAAPRR